MASENLPENCLKQEENASKDYIELEIPHKLYETLASGNCDMLNMCRVCLSTNNDVLYSLLSAKDSVLCSMFATFTNMQVAVDDGLPSHLCETCQMQVVQCYEFKLKCERAHCLLKSVLNGEFLAKEELPVPVTEDTNLPVKDEIKNEIEFHEDCEYLEDVKEKDSDDDTLYIVQSTKKTKKHKMKYLSESDLRINKAIKEKNLLGKRGKKYVCNLCSKVFLKEKTFRSHIESQHLDENKPTGPLPFPCSQCKYAFDSEHDLAIHSAVHSKLSKSNVFKCNKCSKDFKSKGAFRRHLLRHMKSKRYACDVCAKSFTELYALRRHLRVHTGERVEKKHQCHLCDKRYSESSQLTVHLSRHVGLRPWRCPECHKTFPSERLLDSHRLVHSDQKAYPCSYCDRRFRHESTRNTHHRTHTGEKPYVCSVCGKSFIQNSNLTLHMRTHTGERPYSCAVCSCRFKSSSSLKTHERVHTGERPYACAVCGKRFARRNMAAHLRAHSGERPFACSVCPKRFVNNSRLRDHFRVHTGEKPFECASCTLTFATKSHLVKHLKAHQQPPTKKTKKQIKPPLLLDKPDQVYILTPFELPQSPANTVIVENGIMTHSDNKEIPSNMDIPLELSGELVLQDTGSLKGGVIVVDNELQSEYQNSIKDDMCLSNADVNIINNDIASSSHDGATVKLYQLDQSLVQIHSAGGQVTISKITSKMTANF